MKIILHAAVGGCSSRDEVEIPDEVWTAMSEAEREAECNSYLEGHIGNSLNASWWPEEAT